MNIFKFITLVVGFSLIVYSAFIKNKLKGHSKTSKRLLGVGVIAVVIVGMDILSTILKTFLL